MTVIKPIPEFGIKREKEERRDGGCGIVFDPDSRKFAVGRQFKNGRLRFFSGGVDSGEGVQAGILREVTEESGLHNFAYIEKIAEAIAHYYNTLRNVNRVAHAICFLIVLKDTDLLPVKLEEHEKFELVWASANEILANFKKENGNKDNDHWIYFMEKGLHRLVEFGYKLNKSRYIWE